jgi:hypothetical protein
VAAGIFIHNADAYLECRLLIAHPSRPRILTVRQANAWALPALTPLEQHPAAVRHLNDAVFRLFGLNTFTRRMMSENPGNSGYEAIHRFYELEVIGELAKQRIERTAWAGRTVLGEMVFDPSSDKEEIESWINEYESEEPSDTSDASRPPWSLSGWYEIASSWMRRQSTGTDSTGKSIPDQHWTDEQMTILSAPSEFGITVMTSEGEHDALDPSEWSERHGWETPELIIKDDARHWSLYRTRNRATDS